MDQQTVIQVVQQALITTFWLSLPLLGVAFLAGVVISLLQIVTSIQDPAFGSVPRLAALLAGVVLFLPWMLTRLIAYTAGILGDLGRYAR
jgi:flagellar biosynthetic protein FliQ